jgi:signal peptidase II
VDRAGRRAAATLFGTAAVAYLLDRVSKLWVERTLQDHPAELIRGVLTLRYTTNSGGAFSLGERAPWVFVGASLVVCVAIVLTATRHRGRLQAVALGLILGGALGNLTDRIVRGPAFRGRVVDFIDLHVWPVFNLADSAIVIGALLLIWASLWGDRAPAATHEGAARDA